MGKRKVIIGAITVLILGAIGVSAVTLLNKDGVETISNGINNTILQHADINKNINNITVENETKNEVVVNEVVNEVIINNEVENNIVNSNIIGNSVNNIKETVTKEYIVEKVQEVEKQTKEDLNMSWNAWEMPKVMSLSNLNIHTNNINYVKVAITESGKDSVNIGETVRYIIGIENTTTSDILGMSISDVVPEQTLLLPESITNNGVYNEDFNRIDWKVNILAKEIKLVEFEVMVLEDASGSISNFGIVNGNKTNVTINPVNNIFAYTVEYYYDGTIDNIKTENLSAVFGSQITQYQDKNIVGYKKVNEENLGMTIGTDLSANVIKVYYEKDTFGYTVEYYYDGTIDNSKTENLSAVFGSQITQYQDKNIEGYKKTSEENLGMTIGTDLSANVIKVYYEKDTFGYTVEYYYDGTIDNSKTENLSAVFGSQITQYQDKNIEGYKKTSEENLGMTIGTDLSANVIKVYYEKDTFGYTVEYYYDGTIDNSKTENLSAVFGSQITQYQDKNIEGYKKTSEENLGMTIGVDTSANVIKVYYEKDTFGYTVEYYYDGTIDNNKTENLSAVFGSQITQYQDKNIEGYKKTSEENLGMTIGVDTSANIIKVYYEKDTFYYIVEYYYDGAKDASKTEMLDGKYQEKIETYPKKMSTGYKFTKTEGLPLNITTDIRQNIIKVYYEKDKFAYKVEYYYDNIIDSNKTYNGNATKYGEEITAYPDKNIEGYKLEKTKNLPLTISESEVRNVIGIYYEKDTFGYTVEYYYNGVIDNSKTENLSAIYGSQITQYQDKNIEGYKNVSVENLGMTIGVNVSSNVIKVYYEKDSFGYKVEYYYNGVIDNSKTENLSAVFGSQITQYQDKNIKGYTKVNEENLGMTIGTNVSNNVIKVYYEKDIFAYKVEYYYDGVMDNSKTENSSATYESEITTFIDKSNGHSKQNEENLPLIISEDISKNIIKIFYVSDANITVEKIGVQKASVGDMLEYTIRVRNSGGKAATISVTDNLPDGLTYQSSTMGGAYSSKKVQWNNIQIPGVELAGNDKTVEIKLIAKVNNNQYGKTLTNTVELSNGAIDTVTTLISEKEITVNEMKEGQQGKSANIILVMDLSSSMNETVSGQTFKTNSNYVAPGDQNKTRIYAAKTAASNFIEKIYENSESTNSKVSVITFNNSNTSTHDTIQLQGYGDVWATDGNYYGYTYNRINIGTQVLRVNSRNYANNNNYRTLMNSVENLTIGSARSNYGTYIKPAIEKTKALINEYKALNSNENIVIILSDGKPNDVDLSNAYNNIKPIKDIGATVYSIGFGTDASNVNTDAYKILKTFSSDNKVYAANDTATLIAEFKTILETINSTNKVATVNGEIFVTSSKELAYPIQMYHNGILVFNCQNKNDLVNYALAYNQTSKKITWNLNEYLKNNPSLGILSGKIELIYYIKR